MAVLVKGSVENTAALLHLSALIPASGPWARNGDKEVFISLCAQYSKNGALSERQWAYASLLAKRYEFRD